MKGKPNGLIVKRTHKEAREYWNEIEENRDEFETLIVKELN